MIVYSNNDTCNKALGVIKGYVEVNDDVENETMKYLGEVWTERQKDYNI